MKNRVESGFFEVMNSSSTSMCSIIIKITLYYSVCMRNAHIGWERTHIGWSRTCSTVNFIL